MLGLTDNTTGPASSVIIDSYPSPPFVSPLPEGNDATTWGTQIFNDFTVTGGSITNSDFVAQTAGGNGPNTIGFNLRDTSIIGFNFSLIADFNSSGGSFVLSESINSTSLTSTALNNNVNSIPFEFNENLGVLTFLSIVGIGKGIEKWKKRKNKDSDSDSAEK